MEAQLADLGLHLSPTWVSECVHHLATEDAGYTGLPPERQVEMVYREFLQCDLNSAGAGCLPDNVQDMHKEVLQGRYVLQLDEAVDIGSGFKERYTESSSAGRCLKLHFTDGKRRVVGLEYRRLPALSVLEAAGIKVAVTDAQVRRGMLFLRPENLSVLGGCAPELEAARQRMVSRWLQPAGPVRARVGAPHAQLPELAAEAAWPDAPQPPGVNGASVAGIGGDGGGGGGGGSLQAREGGSQLGAGAGGGGGGSPRLTGGAASGGGRLSSERGSMPPLTGPGAGTQPPPPPERLRRWDPAARNGGAGTSGVRGGGANGEPEVIISSSSDSEGGGARGGPTGPPFVYLADVGRQAGGTVWVKCSLTSLKGLDFRDARGRPLPEYRAHVTIEDGSCPPQEAAIAHGPMLRLVGRTPAELVGALAGATEEKAAVKRRLNEATRELMVFEGLMAVECPAPGAAGGGTPPLVVTELRAVTAEHGRGLLRRAARP